jgi:hypothetical protein
MSDEEEKKSWMTQDHDKLASSRQQVPGNEI